MTLFFPKRKLLLEEDIALHFFFPVSIHENKNSMMAK